MRVDSKTPIPARATTPETYPDLSQVLNTPNSSGGVRGLFNCWENEKYFVKKYSRARRCLRNKILEGFNNFEAKFFELNQRISILESALSNPKSWQEKPDTVSLTYPSMRHPRNAL